MKYLQLLRPAHWIKNMFVLAALVFGRKLYPLDMLALQSAIGAFWCFCMASSAIYIVNDIFDRRNDLMHPQKKNRPIATGEVPVSTAIILAIVCAAVAVAGAFYLVRNFAVVLVIYVVMMVLYSGVFKQMIILDCIIIAIGFCLRAISGAIVIGVYISPWLIICTFALTLFLAFGKRRSEIAMLDRDSELFRRTLGGYTPELLAHMLDVTSGLAVVCFLLYAMDRRTYLLFGTNNLVYTTPLVLYCVFRFSALIQKGKYAGPVQLLLRDKPFQAGFIFWIVGCFLIIYADKIGLPLTSIWSY